MKHKGEHKHLTKNNGMYHVDIDISVAEWKQMLADESVFYPEAKEMILQWYFQEGHQSTSKNIMQLYHPSSKGTIYNGIVVGLSKQILNFLDHRFWVESEEGDGESFWCIPFEGWHVDYNESKNFVWKLRDKLVQAIDESPKFQSNFTPYRGLSDLESLASIATIREGKKQVLYTTKYERNSQTRDRAIQFAMSANNGRLVCAVCGFDFEKTYGEWGKNFIEVHHVKPLYSLQEEVHIIPETDLVCLCSNCHRMIHRNKAETLTVQQLKSKLKK